MRLTLNKLLELCNDALTTVESGFTASEIHRTRYRPHEYHGGAAHYNVKVCSPDNADCYFWMNIFYPLRDIREELEKGKRIIVKAGRNNTFIDAEFDISR